MSHIQSCQFYLRIMSILHAFLTTFTDCILAKPSQSLSWMTEKAYQLVLPLLPPVHRGKQGIPLKYRSSEVTTSPSGEDLVTMGRISKVGGTSMVH